MQYLGGKLSAAQLQVGGWVGSVRRSLQGALELFWEEGAGGDGDGRFQRVLSPLQTFARRSRRSLRNFSIRSRQTLQRRPTEPNSVRSDEHKCSVFTLLTGLCVRMYVCVCVQISTPLLDTQAQRSRAELGKKRSQRTRPPRSTRPGLTLLSQTEGPAPDWRTCDSTVTSKQRESDSEEEQPRPKVVCSPPSSSQRVPVFPGLSPSALVVAVLLTVHSCVFFRTASSPLWLKELKSKKRQSLHNNDS
uniref:Tankyrase 1-binding protein C-terminal domain-containing protein n=1 Tax=Myripristis murdjan TaxID=586833 RepID=A0A667XYM3_9TELE